MKQFRELMQYERNLEVLTTIRNEMSTWLVGRTASTRACRAARPRCGHADALQQPTAADRLGPATIS